MWAIAVPNVGHIRARPQPNVGLIRAKCGPYQGQTPAISRVSQLQGRLPSGCEDDLNFIDIREQKHGVTPQSSVRDRELIIIIQT